LAASTGLLVSLGAPAAATARPATTGTTAAALIRVAEIGYPQAGSKRAYLMTSAGESGAGYAVPRAGDGAVAFSGTVGASLGAWNARYRHIYALDFDPVQTPGTYSISLGGNAPASSPSFVIAPAATLYRQPLQNALSFFQNERDGPQIIPSALRSAAAHLNDRVASTYLTPRINGEGEFAPPSTTRRNTATRSSPTRRPSRRST
jgi:endoglucanase